MGLFQRSPMTFLLKEDHEMWATETLIKVTGVCPNTCPFDLRGESKTSSGTICHLWPSRQPCAPGELHPLWPEGFTGWSKDATSLKQMLRFMMETEKPSHAGVGWAVMGSAGSLRPRWRCGFPVCLISHRRKKGPHSSSDHKRKIDGQYGSSLQTRCHNVKEQSGARDNQGGRWPWLAGRTSWVNCQLVLPAFAWLQF